MASPDDALMLAINAGSSSIKFALFQATPAREPVFRGALSDIGGGASAFAVEGGASDTFARHFAIPEHVTAANVLVEWLLARLPPAALQAIAYRVVHGGPASAATREIDPAMLADLYASTSSEPDHLPHELRLIELLRRHYPGSAHIACFDSSFHASMPPVAATLPIPRRYQALGMKRHGFHGLSCAWLMGELARVAGPQAAAGKVVIAHLGGGSSVTAVENGLSRDTSMGLTPAGGMMMGKRSGDLDPGLAWHLARSEQMSPSSFNHMVNHQSGLLGISGTSADLRVLLASQARDSRAAEAVAMFCYQARKTIGAMAAAIDGVDTLIFAGGIGEHAAEVRARVCAGLSHLGVALDAGANEAGAALISDPSARVSVRVMRTDEEAMLAAEARAWLGARAEGGHA
ncbi:acetate/propionate family kinase [Massilia sp. CCM 9210]|uniref:acetate/propionate family kinase n=1 Tax=Massilia scottii TaxID=3057166 RepID=UPI002796CDEC|nr:acetate/propionate family kinase [Massilia sp. CCM 9210]MDQ1816386.1 acetate/propionate family kinase [Massilia sp. CCM 9210]